MVASSPGARRLLEAFTGAFVVAQLDVQLQFVEFQHRPVLVVVALLHQAGGLLETPLGKVVLAQPRLQPSEDDQGRRFAQGVVGQPSDGQTFGVQARGAVVVPHVDGRA
jgi:hypothetical protein